MVNTLIHQPEYLPWSNFFLKLNDVNHYVFLDSVQYNRRSFQNRNYIKTQHGIKFLTVPIIKSHQKTLIKEIKIDNTKNWINDHINLIIDNYKNSNFFKKIFPELEKIYFKKKWEYLSDLNINLTKFFFENLKFNFSYYLSSEFNLDQKNSDLMLIICQKLKTNNYITGPGSKSYLKEKNFENQKINIIYKYPKKIFYKQQFMEKGFLKDLCILDYVFNCGFDDFRNKLLKNNTL